MMTPRQRKTLERLVRVCEDAWTNEAHWMAHAAVHQCCVELEHLLQDDALGHDLPGPVGEREQAEGHIG